MLNQYKSDYMNGREVPQLAVKEDYVLAGIHAGTVHIEKGQFTLEGTLQGTLDIQTNITATINGKQQGSVSIGAGSVVTVNGSIQGSTTVHPDATLIIEATGRLAGALTNNGTVVLRGVYGGRQTGDGEFRLEGKGYIKQPAVTTRSGSTTYYW